MELRGKAVAVLADDFYEILQFWVPYYRMLEAGAAVKVISRGESHLSGDALPGRYPSQPRDLKPSQAQGRDFDAVIIPGGYAPDYLRADDDIVRFVREIDNAGKLVAAICRGPWLPITAGLVSSRTMTCAASIRLDLENAGATYGDRPVVQDRNFITARSSEDLPAFCRQITMALSGSPDLAGTAIGR